VIVPDYAKMNAAMEAKATTPDMAFLTPALVVELVPVELVAVLVWVVVEFPVDVDVEAVVVDDITSIHPTIPLLQ